MKQFRVSNTAELTAAIDEIRQAKCAAEITLAAGIYVTDKSISLDNLNGVSLKSDGEVRIIGGKLVTEWCKISEHDARGKFDDSVRDKVCVSNLGSIGMTKDDAGTFESRGFSRSERPSHAEVFVNAKPLNLSQYPKRGEFLSITGYETPEGDEGWGQVNGKLSDGFYYTDDRPKSWKNTSDIIVHGYWSYDWANSYEQIEEFDADKMYVKNKPPYGNYQFRVGQRFCFMNVLEEVKYPGDYYIDRGGVAPVLYFIPYENDAVSEIVVSTLSEPIISVNGAQNVTVSGITIEAGRGNGVQINNSTDVKIDRCIIRNMGNSGVKVTRSKRVDITNNSIHDTGDNGASFSGGNVETLERADYLFESNHVYKIAKWTRCYVCAAHLNGVGMTARRNTIHDCPHTAIFFNGNEMEVTDNEIYSVVLETGDAGAIYSGRRYEWRGNNISRNFIHHLGGVGMGTMGIYNDDCLSGTTMEGNWFWECSRAAFMGGGRGFTVKDNVFVDCYPSIPIDGRGASAHSMWRNMVLGFMKDNFMKALSYKDENGDSVYLKKYPELQEIIDFYNSADKPLIPPSATISGNVFCSDRKVSLDWDSEYGDFTITRNHTAKRDDFESAKFGDFRLKATSEAIARGATPHDLSSAKSGATSSALPERFADVHASLHLSEDKTALVLDIRNSGDYDESGSYILKTTDPDNAANGKEIAFTVKAKSEATYAIPLSSAKRTKAEATSTLPGARPACVNI